MANIYGHGPTRLIFEQKDPRGFAEFITQLAEHSTEGSALTLTGAASDPSLWWPVDLGQARMHSPLTTVKQDLGTADS